VQNEHQSRPLTILKLKEEPKEEQNEGLKAKQRERKKALLRNLESIKPLHRLPAFTTIALAYTYHWLV
jgi:hypothetical protein